jgi:hypothetical protein
LPAADPDHRDVAFGHLVLETLQRQIAADGTTSPGGAPSIISSFARKNQLGDLDLSQNLKKQDCLGRVDAALERLFRPSADRAP